MAWSSFSKLVQMIKSIFLLLPWQLGFYGQKKDSHRIEWIVIFHVPASYRVCEYECVSMSVLYFSANLWFFGRWVCLSLLPFSSVLLFSYAWMCMDIFVIPFFSWDCFFLYSFATYIICRCVFTWWCVYIWDVNEYKCMQSLASAVCVCVWKIVRTLFSWEKKKIVTAKTICTYLVWNICLYIYLGKKRGW